MQLRAAICLQICLACVSTLPLGSETRVLVVEIKPFNGYLGIHAQIGHIESIVWLWQILLVKILQVADSSLLFIKGWIVDFKIGVTLILKLQLVVQVLVHEGYLLLQ